MGGMAAFIPSRRDPKVNEVALPRVRDDKLRESRDGFDGTWVAHPDLVPVAREVFAEFMGDRPNQLDRQRPEVAVEARQLLDLRVPDGQITEAGLRNNISVSLQYLESWLRGIGCVPIFNLMEDAATVEIARSQIWQWLHHPKGILADGRKITNELYQQLTEEELAKIKATLGEEEFASRKFTLARELLNKIITNDQFTEFLTLPAYQYID
jgi:malate synthase